MLKLFAKLVFKIIGFKIEGNYPLEQKKMIIAVVPHTSNWDFPLGILTKWYLGANINFIGKSSLFKKPYGWFFRYLGGTPIDRSKSQNTVRAVANAFEREERLTIAIAPEGTRSKVDRLKGGFYYIAKLAEIPILLVKFDFQNRLVGFSELFYPSENEEKDWEFLNNYWNGIHGKIPEKSFGYTAP